MSLWKTDLVKLTWYHFYEVTDLADVIKFCRALTGYYRGKMWRSLVVILQHRKEIRKLGALWYSA